MSSTPLARRQSARLTPKTILFALIGLMLLYVLYHTEHFLIDPTDPSWPHYREVAGGLLPHGLIGALALTLAFLQFNQRLRSRYPRLHRVCGRIYVTAVFIVAPLGVYLGYLDQKIGYDWSFIAACIVFAALWLLATAMAFGFIRAGRVEQHRRWMTRSLAMALVFVEVRVVSGLTGWENAPASDTTAVWVCIALGYPLADLVLQLEESLRWRGKSPLTAAAAAP